MKFEEYIENLKKEVTARPPNSEKESGFKTAVMIIHARYKMSKK